MSAAETAPQHAAAVGPPVYAVVDRRADGSRRVVFACRNPDEAVAAARALAAAGDHGVDVELIARDYD